MKKNLIIVLAFFISLTCLSNQMVYAEKLSQNKEYFELETNEFGVSSLFFNFINNCFMNLDGVQVIDINGLDVTKNFINETSHYYSLKDYEAIQNLIISKKLLVSYEKIIPEKNYNSDSQIMSIKTQTVKKTFYHNEWDLEHKFKKEWTSTLTGKYSYNFNTRRIVSASSPTISFNTNFGAAFVPSINNIRTNYSLSNSGMRLTFTGSYNMNATLGIPIGDLEIGYPIHFGNFRDIFDV